MTLLPCISKSIKDTNKYFNEMFFMSQLLKSM
jgi:hypothetical protein